MSPAKRLTASQRKIQICEASKSIFLRKGYAYTTMEDIVKETGLSKGGLYHHYGSTSEIFYDLMAEGTNLRFKQMEAFIAAHNNLSPKDLLIELTLMKILDFNEYKSLYAMFLMEIKKDPKLRSLYKKIEAEAFEDIIKFSNRDGFECMSCMINEEFVAFVNSMIVATEVLDVREIFLNHSDFFRKLIKNYIEEHS